MTFPSQVSYTLGSIFPILAIVENPNPPAYERVALNDDADDSEAAPLAGADAATNPTSASLRALSRLLYSVGGWRGSFRGIWCAAAYGVAVSVAGSFIGAFPFVPSFVGTLLACLALVQLSAAWAHIVITPSNPAPFYRRLPPLKRTFEATCFPTLAVWLATTLTTEVPRGIAYLLHLPIWDPSRPNDIPTYHWSDSWKGSIMAITSLAIYVFAFIPAYVVLVRVQASLLPPEEDTIVAVDRSFGNTVEPAIVGGKGFVTMKDAMKTVSRESWIRIYLLQAKVFAVGVAVNILMLAILLPEVILMSKSVVPEKGN